MVTTAERISDAWVAEHLPPRPERAHKGDFGRVLVLAGSIDFPGAALLTALGAMRAGAGVVRVATGDSVAARLAGSIPELTWMALDEESPGFISPGGWRRLGAEAPTHDAVVIGPGLGRHPATQRRTRQLIGSLRVPAIVDADGLNALAAGDRWWQSVRGPLVLTPHPGEFSRLMGQEAPAADDDAGRAEAAAEAASRWNQVVVLKGAKSVIAQPGEMPMHSDVAAASLATAGSGDVLAGVIGALVAGGATPFAAAVCGVAVHAAAGLLAADRIGRAGVMAGDLAALLPEAIEQFRAPTR